MVYLNGNDLIQLKYLLISTGLVTKTDVINLKHADEVLEKLKNKLLENKCGELYEEVRNDSLNMLKFFNVLHQNDSCPTKCNGEANTLFSEASRLIAGLYVNLVNEQFFEMLSDCFCVLEQQYYNLELDIAKLKCELYLPKIRDWLKEKNNPYSKNIEDFMRKRSGNLDSSNLIGDLDISNLIVSPVAPAVETGICLVISNENFIKYSQRKGTVMDEKNIRKTFNKLGYKVIVEQNVTSDEMFSIFENTKEDIKPNHKRLIIFLLSHGKKNILISSDDKDVSFDEITDCFRVSKCQILGGKSKIFFFVCCQGDEINKAIEVDSASINSNDIEEDCPPKTLLPDVSDFFICYATYRSHVSFRDINDGTFYISKLCAKINQYPEKKISDIHQEIQRDFAEIPISGRDCFQVPYYENVNCNGDLYLN